MCEACIFLFHIPLRMANRCQKCRSLVLVVGYILCKCICCWIYWQLIQVVAKTSADFFLHVFIIPTGINLHVYMIRKASSAKIWHIFCQYPLYTQTEKEESNLLIYIYIYIYMRTYIYTYIRTYIQTYLHTYIHGA